MVWVYRIVVCSFLLLSIAGCTQPHKQVILAFYNCEDLFDTVHTAGKGDEEFTPQGNYRYTSQVYTEKLHNIARVLAKMVTDEVPNGPSLIGLAEVENDHVLDALVAQAAIVRRHYKYIWFNGPDKRGINVALLYDPASFAVIRSEPLTVLLGDTTQGSTRDILHVFGVLYGDTVHILVNHWPSRLGGTTETEPKRALAAMTCRSKLVEILQAKGRVIVMGDLNENPDDSSIVNILHASSTKAGTCVNDLYDPWAKLYQEGKGTLFYKRHWHLFDQILISQAFLSSATGWQFDKVEIFTPSFIADHHDVYETVPYRSFAGSRWRHGYSDHFPVLLYLKRSQ